MGSQPHHTKWTRGATAVLAIALVTLALPWAPHAGAAPTVSGGGTFAYTEQDPATPVGAGLTIADGTSYDGSYIEFEVDGAQSTEELALATSGSADVTAGVVSIVGTSVYLGNGTTADPIGTVDPVRDGTSGKALRVNFTSPFENPGFETGDVTSWTALEQRVDLGVTEIAGHVVQDTATYPPEAVNADDDAPASSTWAVETTTDGQPTEGAYALRLRSSMQTANNCDVVHGPAAYSSEFEAAAGDEIYFDWRAFAGGDAYHVFGYIQDRDGNQTEVLDAFTYDTNGSSNWATKATTIPSTGHYRFVFVAGTFDASCGRAAGAQLLIDNVRVFGNKVNDTVAEQVGWALTYRNTGDDPPTVRTIDVTAASAGNGVGTGTITVNVTPVDDAPSIDPVSGPTFTNLYGPEDHAPVTGTITASDPESDPLTFGIVGGEAATETIDGVTYTHRKVGTYATVHVAADTGAYVVVPHDDAIDARTAGTTEQFTLVTEAGTLGDTTTLTVTIAVPPSVPGPISGLAPTRGDETVTLSWTAPAWLGGSAITGYRIETSTDGVHWQTAIADTGTPATSATLTGLENGRTYEVRVSAINSTGVGVVSSVVSATPATTPGAPTITSIVPGDRTMRIAVTRPTDTGGSPLTGYRYSVDGGVTWSKVVPLSATIDVFGLGNGTSYPVVVRAVNGVGEGLRSATVTGVPVRQPVPAPSPGGDPSPNPSPEDLSVPPGGSRVVVNGDEVTADVVVGERGVQIQGDGWSIAISGASPSRTALRVDSEGRLVVDDGGYVVVTGTGFAPGTLVDVWVFFTPQLLGEVLVGPDGTFTAELALPDGLEIGEHTVQLNGVGQDGTSRSASLGIVVQPYVPAQPAPSQRSSGSLPRTGGDAADLVVFGLGLLVVGAGLAAGGRRRSAVTR